MSDEESKIVVDEDFKAQVEREREQQRQAEEAAKTTGGTPGPDGEQEIPPASMGMLISMLSSQVMMAMGFLPTPDGQQPPVDLPLAKHFIDLLTVLEEKTKGNLDEDEQSMLTESLHQFRMAYVQYSQGGAGEPGAGGDDAPPASTIELP
jgi:hypothetical protein